MKKSDDSWLPEFMAAVKKCVLKGDYKRGMALARAELKRHPDSFECKYQYAKLMGDWADELPPAQRKKRKAEAVAILKPLTRQLAGRDVELRFGLCLNYYYQSQDFLGMVSWGRRMASAGVRKGHYAQGLGSALRAADLRKSGDLALSRSWAKKSLAAWKRFDLTREDYYFPFYAKALAEALLGEKKASLESLKRAAKLSGRTIQDWEFADVLQLIQASK